MPASLECKFKGRENQVLEEVACEGIGPVMKRYGLKHSDTFIHWAERHRDPDLSKLAGQNGGQKGMFYRQHHATIMDCLEIFGEVFVMRNFHIHTKDTLDSVINGTDKPVPLKLGKTDRLELKVNAALEMAKDVSDKIERLEIRLEMLSEDYRGTRQGTNELKELLGSFTEAVSSEVSRMLIMPLLQRIIPVDESLAKREDLLNVEALITQGERLLAEPGDNGGKPAQK